jgi:hypothetical protein
MLSCYRLAPQARLPDGTDPADLLALRGPAALTEALATAQPLVDERLANLPPGDALLEATRVVAARPLALVEEIIVAPHPRKIVDGRRHHLIRAMPSQDPEQKVERLNAVHEVRVKIISGLSGKSVTQDERRLNDVYSYLVIIALASVADQDLCRPSACPRPSLLALLQENGRSGVTPLQTPGEDAQTLAQPSAWALARAWVWARQSARAP